MGKQQRDTFFFFLDTLRLLLAESHDHCMLDNHGERVNVALARLERDFPVSIQVIVVNTCTYNGIIFFTFFV